MKVFRYFSPLNIKYAQNCPSIEMSVVEFCKILDLKGTLSKLHFRKNFLKCLVIHAVDICTSIHSHYQVVVVGALKVAHYGEFQVLSLIELSPVGFNMINSLKLIYPGWIWLSMSIFIDVGVIIIILGLNKIGPWFIASFLALAYTVVVSYFMA